MKKTLWFCIAPILFMAVIAFTACESSQHMVKDSEANKKTEISEEILKEDAEFIKQIEELHSTIFVDYGFLDDLKELLTNFGVTGPNLIVRCEVVSRGETAVITSLSTFTNEDLKSDNEEYVRIAIDCIRTPYKVKIKEVYHGTINKEDDIITVIAPYGTIDGFANKDSDYPIYGVGCEYILFFHIFERFGELEYWLVLPPFSWVKLDTQKGTFETSKLAQSMYSKYKGSTEKLVGDLKKLIKNNDLITEVESYGDIESALEYKRQKNNSQGEK